ncbi:MAG TPA: DsbA family protein [Steroidobacteraceae bacterium]|nr:DsbA family protein [Steroidobacteraceae bacterium]
MPKMLRPSWAFPVALAALAMLLLPPRGRADVPPPSDPAVLTHAEQAFHDSVSPVMGNPHGDVTVVEFFDYACSYCKAMQPRVEALLRSDHDVKLILKEFPILTPESLIATKVALAAVRQGKYARFHDALMDYHGPWNTAAIWDTARAVGLNLPRLRRDMASPAITAEIIANFNLARGLRIFQTPGVIVGTHILTGPSAQFDFPKEVAEVRAHAAKRGAVSG